MFDWIRDLVEGAESRLRSLARAIADRIASLYTYANRAFTRAKTALHKFAIAVGSVRSYLVSQVKETFLTLRWLEYVRIPALIGYAKSTLLSTVSRLVAKVRDTILSRVSAVVMFVERSLDRARKAIADIRDWALYQVALIMTTLTRVRDIVYALLTKPEHLAAWLASAMVAQMMLYLDRNIDQIMAWIRYRSVQFLVASLPRIESIIGRMM